MKTEQNIQSKINDLKRDPEYSAFPMDVFFTNMHSVLKENNALIKQYGLICKVEALEWVLAKAYRLDSKEVENDKNVTT
jgi:hypothetical protein